MRSLLRRVGTLGRSAARVKRRGSSGVGARKGGLAGARAFSDEAQTKKAADTAKVADAIAMNSWDRWKKRTGVLGQKMGMMQLWDEWGEQFVVTAIKVDSVVMRHEKGRTKRGFKQMQLAGGRKNPKFMTFPILGEFKKADLDPRRKLTKFQVSDDALLPVGFEIDARHFVPGQYVDVQGKTKGKGFAGVMKRWGFAGQAATHGVSKAHRLPGSIGQCQTPGRVFKGKKMAGRMGGKKATAECVKVVRINVDENVIMVKGSVPGANGSFVKIRDSIKRPLKEGDNVPFPTFVQLDGDDKVSEINMPAPEADPFEWMVR